MFLFLGRYVNSLTTISQCVRDVCMLCGFNSTLNQFYIMFHGVYLLFLTAFGNWLNELSCKLVGVVC